MFVAFPSCPASCQWATRWATSASPFPFRKPATQGSCSIDNKCCNICWSEPCVTIFGSCLDCVTIEGEITWWAPRHALVGEEQRLFVPFFFALSPPYALIETNTAERRLYIIILHSRYLLIFPPVLQQLSFKSTHVTYPFLVFIHMMLTNVISKWKTTKKRPDL